MSVELTPIKYMTYYLIIVAASSILKALERQKVTGRPATVLHYYTVLIKVTSWRAHNLGRFLCSYLFDGNKCAVELDGNNYSYKIKMHCRTETMAIQTIHSMA